jgi:hypothetical protein
MQCRLCQHQAAAKADGEDYKRVPPRRRRCAR